MIPETARKRIRHTGGIQGIAPVLHSGNSYNLIKKKQEAVPVEKECIYVVLFSWDFLQSRSIICILQCLFHRFFLWTLNQKLDMSKAILNALICQRFLIDSISLFVKESIQEPAVLGGRIWTCLKRHSGKIWIYFSSSMAVLSTRHRQGGGTPLNSIRSSVADGKRIWPNLYRPGD